MYDLISRETMKDKIDSTTWYHQNRNKDMVEGASVKSAAWFKAEDVYKAIENVPTAQPERKKGKLKLNKEGNWACPFCEFDPYHDNMKGMNYCPNCGTETGGGGMNNLICTQEAIDAIKCIAYEVISETIGSPYDYIDTSRDDLLTLGEIYGIVKVTNTICEKAEANRKMEASDDNQTSD